MITGAPSCSSSSSQGLKSPSSTTQVYNTPGGQSQPRSAFQEGREVIFLDSGESGQDRDKEAATQAGLGDCEYPEAG